MAKITTEVEAFDKDGKAIDLGAGGNSNKYRLAEPGWYTAIVRKVVSSTFTDKQGVVRMKVTPLIELVRNEDGEIPVIEISRQDWIVGAINKSGALYRPDGDESKSALWGGSGGAQYLLLALGLLTQTAPGKYAINVDIDLVKDRVVKVKVETAVFQRPNPQPGQDVEGKKNLITQVRSLADSDEALAERVEEFGYYLGSNRQVYESELVFNNQERILEAGEDDSEAF